MSSNIETPPTTASPSQKVFATPSAQIEGDQQSTHSNDKSVSGAAKPMHYLARPDGTYTPMIAVDELPTSMKIADLRSSYTTQEVSDVNGIAINAHGPMAKTSYKVVISDGHSETSITIGGDLIKSDRPGPILVPSDASLAERLAECLEGVELSAHAEALKAKILRIKNQNGSDYQPRNNQDKTQHQYNPVTKGIIGRKIYCTHWMRTGECDFMQQGCMFLHSMPDLEMLESLGFRSYPRWFREMPHEYRVQNAKDFDYRGLHEPRPSHNNGMSNGRDWSNVRGNRNQYNHSRGPQHSPAGNYGRHSSPGFSSPGNGYGNYSNQGPSPQMNAFAHHQGHGSPASMNGYPVQGPGYNGNVSPAGTPYQGQNHQSYNSGPLPASPSVYQGQQNMQGDQHGPYSPPAIVQHTSLLSAVPTPVMSPINRRFPVGSDLTATYAAPISPSGHSINGANMSDNSCPSQAIGTMGSSPNLPNLNNGLVPMMKTPPKHKYTRPMASAASNTTQGRERLAGGIRKKSPFPTRSSPRNGSSPSKSSCSGSGFGKNGGAKKYGGNGGNGKNA